MIEDQVNTEGMQGGQETCSITGTLAGYVPNGNSDLPPRIERNFACTLWPHAWKQDDSLIAIDGYIVWPDKLMLGCSREDMHKMSAAFLRNPRSWLREVRNGCFNIVVHDFRNRRTLLASDRFGFLPLYIFSGKDGWWFASDLESLRAIAPCPLERDKTGLAELYWFGYQIGDRTAYKNVRMMPAGTMISLSWLDGSIKEELWYEKTEPCGEHESVSLEEASARYVELVTEACDRLYHPDLRYGITLSGGMDSRMIAACWRKKPMHSYTWGDRGSMEMAIAAKLAARLGFHHTEIPVQGDFFRSIHPQMFRMYGLVEFVSGIGTPYMRRNGTQIVLDGIMGDVLFSAIFMKRRKTLTDNLRYGLGMPYIPRKAPESNDAVAHSIFSNICVADAGISLVSGDVKCEIDRAHDSILDDLSKEVRKFRNQGDSLERIIENVKVNNRTRRYITLISASSRPAIQTCFPFVDADVAEYGRQLSPANKGNARLYIKTYSNQLDHVRGVPAGMSLLPFWVPYCAHYYGRIYRHLREFCAERILRLSRGHLAPRAMDAFQWPKWLASNTAFRDGIKEYLADSSAVDAQALSTFLQSGAKYRTWITGTRLMLTLSYCAWHKPEYARGE